MRLGKWVAAKARVEEARHESSVHGIGQVDTIPTQVIGRVRANLTASSHAFQAFSSGSGHGGAAAHWASAR